MAWSRAAAARRPAGAAGASPRRRSARPARPRRSTTTTHLGVECSIETLTLLEHFFAVELGARASNAGLCYFLRDCFEVTP